MDSRSEKQADSGDFKYDLIVTKDGSPTISLHSQNNECMHHRDGAFTESVYIYGQALEKITHPNPSVLSVGLGLGYNELISVAHQMKLNTDTIFHMESFELEPALKENFLGWLKEGTNENWSDIYDTILNRTAEHYGLLPSLIKEKLASMFDKGEWKLRGALDSKTHFDRQFHIILFDAFSSGTSPELWNEDFLNNFLKEASARPCVLTTYAATGSLKRALKNNNFTVDLRKGFSGKRQSTLAIKE